MNAHRHDWLGKYYKVDWQDNRCDDKFVYRRIEKVQGYRNWDYYHVGLSYVPHLGYWVVILYSKIPMRS